MGSISGQQQHPRIPLPVAGIQVNGCRNPTCESFLALTPVKNSDGAVEVSLGAYEKGSGLFQVSGTGKGTSSIFCLKCREKKRDGLEVGAISTSLKSNQAVVEELNRISRHLDPKMPSCPNADCDSNIGNVAGSVKRNGRTASGNQRLKCGVCGKGFTSRPKTRKHSKPHIDIQILKLLVSKVPIRRIAFLCDISTKTVYDKIRFLYRQCQEFSAGRERDLENRAFRRMYFCTDRQVVVSNWTKREDKRNCDIYGIATACKDTGYVFAFNFNFDGSVDAEEIEKDAEAIGEYETPRHHRKYARVWLRQEFNEYLKGLPSKQDLPVGGSLKDEVQIRTLADQKLNLSDSSEHFDRTNILPPKGVLIHNEYTMMAHFFLLKRLFQNTEKTRFFMDLDSGMKAAYLSAFREMVAEGNSDGFLIRAAKNKTVDEKEKIVARFRKMVSVMSGVPLRSLTYQDIVDVSNNIILERLQKPIRIPKSPEKWIEHPGASMAEPEKMVAAITDVERLDREHQANLYRIATLAPVDRFFMKIRRFSTYFERPFTSGTSKGRTWYGYSAYDPTMYTMIGEIFRVYYNYCSEKKTGQTPAMRLGLARGPVEVKKIVYLNNRR